MSNLDLSKKVNIEKIASDGQKVYEKIKNRYESEYNGKFLAIEPESGSVFMAIDAANALVKAKKKYPERLFFLLKIGFDAAFSSISPILLPNKQS